MGGAKSGESEAPSASPGLIRKNGGLCLHEWYPPSLAPGSRGGIGGVRCAGSHRVAFKGPLLSGLTYRVPWSCRKPIK